MKPLSSDGKGAGGALTGALYGFAFGDDRIGTFSVCGGVGPAPAAGTVFSVARFAIDAAKPTTATTAIARAPAAIGLTTEIR
jgi:hypothetical protein